MPRANARAGYPIGIHDHLRASIRASTVRRDRQATARGPHGPVVTDERTTGAVRVRTDRNWSSDRALEAQRGAPFPHSADGKKEYGPILKAGGAYALTIYLLLAAPAFINRKATAR